MKQTPFTTLAGAFRAHVVKQWVMNSGYSAADAMKVMTEYAVNNNLVKRDTPVPGSNVVSWATGTTVEGRKSTTPLWAAQAALLQLIEDGWVPESREEWAGAASLLLTLNAVKLDVLLEKKPTAWPLDVATGWFVAAIEENERYQVSKKLEKRRN